jgi:hypothetical protein
MPRGTPASFRHLDLQLEPPRCTARVGSASSVSHVQRMMSRGRLAVDRHHLVAHPRCRRCSGETRGRRRSLGGQTWHGDPTGGRVGPWLSTRCSSRRPVGSALASRWRSRPWRGWCGPSRHPCTATTRSCTTSRWCSASRTSGWSSSTTSPRCRRVHRSCSPPTDRPPRWWPQPVPTAATWSMPSARWSPRSTTR